MKKLELTWYGKEEKIAVEPRLLIENKKLSNTEYDENTENILIHGDNLLALKALEKKYAGKIKCIYIDPPYNTGSAFKYFDDNLEHSIWLSLMKERLLLLRTLLSEDGILFISIDDDELHYLKVLCDEIFGRKNYCGSFVWEKKKKPSFLSNMGSIIEYILSYSKNKEMSPPFIYGTTTKGKKYPVNNAGNGIRTIIFPPKSVKFNMKDQIVTAQDMSGGNIITKLLKDVEIKEGLNINPLVLEGEWRYSQETIDELIKNQEEFSISKIPFRPNHIKVGGEAKKMKNLLSIAHYDMSTNEDATNESEVLFGYSNSFDNPKPEKLIQVLIGAVTQENDLILDSFLGSGTTIAVAHKMKRRWIGIEMGDHAYTHCKFRLDKVIDGSDKGGITESVKWNAGGGYRFYELAPTLINIDSFGEPIINPEYSAEMLASAVALHEGFEFYPSDEYFWKQSKGNEKSFLFVTTRHLDINYLIGIHESMEEDEYLIIACKSYDKNIQNQFSNIKVKKIPQMLLEKCEFGREHYNLNIVTPPIIDTEEEEA